MSNHGAATYSPSNYLQTEVAVIGSGPGGAITAALCAEAGKDVVLLEDGPVLALESCRPFSRQEMVQKYRNGGITVAMGPTKVAYVEGCCAGGGSEINSGLYHRTPEPVLDIWMNEFQLQGLDNLENHFRSNDISARSDKSKTQRCTMEFQDWFGKSQRRTASLESLQQS